MHVVCILIKASNRYYYFTYEIKKKMFVSSFMQFRYFDDNLTTSAALCHNDSFRSIVLSSKEWFLIEVVHIMRWRATPLKNPIYPTST